MNRPPLRALVADDEPMARARLCRLLGLEGGVEIVAECEDGPQAIAAIRELRPDVAFLDIRMPGVDGFQVATQLAPDATRVVFVTAHAEHALRAFEAAATDYLLKPLSQERLRATLQRVRDHRIASIVPGFPERIVLHSGTRMRLVAVAGIEALVACANYVEVHYEGERYLARDTLGAMESRLDPALFVRIHRSRVVRIGAVRDIELLPSGQYLLRLYGGLRLSSGRSYRERVRKSLGISVQQGGGWP